MFKPVPLLEIYIVTQYSHPIDPINEMQKLKCKFKIQKWQYYSISSVWLYYASKDFSLYIFEKRDTLYRRGHANIIFLLHA